MYANAEYAQLEQCDSSSFVPNPTTETGEKESEKRRHSFELEHEEHERVFCRVVDYLIANTETIVKKNTNEQDIQMIKGTLNLMKSFHF